MHDLIVIGGGINGAGIARDAAMRGLDVLLLERDDWGCGTSSKSSMLAHGGLRYLEQFDLPLVHEALQDRELMFRHAPHLVQPLRFVYPIYPHVASRRTVRVGLLLYDLLSHGKSVPGRSYQKATQLLEAMPGLEPKELRGGATYTDGQFRSVERFVWELVQDARHHGATCRNHTEVARITTEPRGVELADGTHIQGRAVINACGPWVDDLLDASLGGKHTLIRKTKGAHIAVPRFLDDALIVRATDGRTFFFLPWNDVVLIGTTDTDHPDDASRAAADAVDVAYLLEGARQYFPDADLRVLWTYAGVRPLLNQRGLTESNVSRRHALHETAPGVWSVQGGKLTTYRHLAEQATTTVCKALGHGKLAKLRPTRTGTLPGGPLVPWPTFRDAAIEQAIQSGLPAKSAEHVVDTYGAQWQTVAHGDRIQKGLPHVWGEIDHAVQHEDAAHLADVMLRRTHLGLGPGGRMGVARKVAARMADLRDWTDDERAAQLAAYEQEVQRFAVPGAKA